MTTGEGFTLYSAAMADEAQVDTDKNLFLLVTHGSQVKKSNTQLPQWKFENSKLALVPLKDLHGHEPMHLLREGSTGLCLLR